MQSIQTEVIQPLLLSMLKAFQSFAKNNGIRFLLCGGTTLGAVRHKGFIPWDDDIDLYIFQDGFDKLTEIANENPYLDEEKRYRILPPAKYPNVYPFFKIIDTKTIVYEKNLSRKYATGLWLDVFHLSYWADDIKLAKKQFRKQQFYKSMNKLMIGGNYRSTKYKLMEILAAPARLVLNMFGIDSEYCCKKILALDRYTSGEYMGNICWPESFEKEHYRSEWFSETVEVPFEDILCPVPKDYDDILKNFYGDYMTPPPENKRVRHNPEAYYNE